MKLDPKKSTWIRSAWISVFMLFASVETVMAASYTSSVTLPTVHSKGYLYRMDVPVKAQSNSSTPLSNISWRWNVVGWPNYLQVSLCAQSGRCLDISRQRSGSTQFFNGLAVSERFYFAMRMAPAGLVPVAGQQAQLTIDW